MSTTPTPTKAPIKKAALPLDVDRTRERLLRLGLSYAAAELDRRLAEAVKETTPPHAFLDRLLAGEIAGREERRIERSLRALEPAHRTDDCQLRLCLPAGRRAQPHRDTGHKRLGT